MFTINGYTITTAEQARTMLMWAKLAENKRIAEQALSVLKILASK